MTNGTGVTGRRVVVIEVDGGVAEESYVPPGVEVEIYDHDNLKEMGLWREQREAGADEAIRRARDVSEGEGIRDSTGESGAEAGFRGGLTRLKPTARRHLVSDFSASPHPDAYHTYYLEAYPREKDPETEEESRFYEEREDVRTYALTGLSDFVGLVERALDLIQDDADGAAEYRRAAGALFHHINLAVEDDGVPRPVVAGEQA